MLSLEYDIPPNDSSVFVHFISLMVKTKQTKNSKETKNVSYILTSLQKME